MRRRKLPSDDRLNWRDPDMPLLKLGYLNKELVLFEVSPEKVRMHYEDKMEHHPAPSWKDDPSYSWAKKNNLK